MPSDSVQVLSLRLAEDDVEFVDDATWNAYSDSSSPLQHTIARVFAGQIELYPDPGSTTYELRYSYSPAPLDTPEDAPALPAHLHSRLAQYAIAMCRYKEGQLGEGDRMMSLYESALPAPALGAINLRPGPLSIGMAPTPFDSDPDTIHR
jgi:hypothetical protein